MRARSRKNRLDQLRSRMVRSSASTAAVVDAVDKNKPAAATASTTRGELRREIDGNNARDALAQTRHASCRWAGSSIGILNGSQVNSRGNRS